MEELNLVPRQQKDTIKELLDKKRDMAINGSYKLPKLRMTANKMKRNNISIVEEEEDDEERKSNDSWELTKSSLKVCETPARQDSFALTKDNLNKMIMKGQRSNFQGSLVGNLMNSFNGASMCQSQIDFRASPGISCGKMFMLSDRMSFLGTPSNLGQSFSTINSMLSSINDNQSNLITSEIGEHTMRWEKESDFSQIHQKYERVDNRKTFGGRFYKNK
jgi:hypothetical protein